MTATIVNAQRATEALTKVRDIVAEHGTAEQQERLTRIMGGPVPTPNRLPVEHATYQAEALAVLFEMVAGHIEASKPRPRGRPRKDAAAKWSRDSLA
jgi:hypothetical protein